MKKAFLKPSRSSILQSLILVTLLGLMGCRPVPEQLTNLRLQNTTSAEQGLHIQFLGNTNILLDDGETRILTDGFFSRPSARKAFLGKVEPNPTRIKECLQTAGITQLDAVIPVHSHYDHAMDAPVVAQLTGATLIGSPSTMMIGRGAGLKEEQMKIAPLDSVLVIGEFKLRFVKSHHWHYPKEKSRARLLNQGIEEPLITPASIYDYKEGISYTILVEHGETSLAIHGSAGFKANALDGADVDLVFLSIAGLEAMDEAYINDFQTHTVEALHPEVIVPIHWDDFTVPLHRGIKTTNWLAKLLIGADLAEAIDIVQRNNPERTMNFLELWERYPIGALIRK